MWTLDQPIESVAVAGRFQRVSPADVERAVKQKVRNVGLVSVDLADVRKAIASIPWVDTRHRAARLAAWAARGGRRSRWPPRAGARTACSTRAASCSRAMRATCRSELAQLSGPDGTENVVAQRYLASQGRLAEAGLRLTALRLDARGAWEFDLANGVTVRLGRRQVDERFDRFVSTAAKLVTQRADDIVVRRHALHERFCDWVAQRRASRRRPDRRGRFAKMAKRSDRGLIVGLDIGTSKVVALVGEIGPDGGIEVLGVGSHPSRGLKKGVVVNIESTVQSIQRAVEEAELMAGCEIHSVYAGIAGSHVRSLNSHGVVAIRDKEVSHGDVEHVIDAAKAVAIPADQKILHVLPQEFIIDGQEGIRDPIGMSGVRLEAKVHIVTGADSAAQNIEKCIQRCGLEVDDVVLEQLASSFAVLTEDEKELGVCLVDIGGGTTDLAVFSNGAIRHTAVIPIAGDQVTNDIAVSMRTPTQYAEDIKIRYACALSQLANPDESIEVPSVGDRPARRLARQTLAEIVEPRYEELFGLVREELRRSGFEEVIAAGIVLTGGSAKMEGAIELAEEVFHVPVRLGMPQHVNGLSDVVRNPIFSTGVGLLLYARDNHLPARGRGRRSANAKTALDRMKSWFQGNF